MAAKEIAFGDVKSMVGKDLGSSDWHEVTQEDINTFADVTGDHQWIHCDVERARNESPYGTTIAHGYYTLSLVPHLLKQIWQVSDVKMGVNYGLNKLRFPAPVPVGKKVRAHAALTACEDIEGGIQVSVNITIEVEDSEKPAAAIEGLFRYYN